MPAVTVAPTPCVRGRVRPPGDKAISHRYALLAAIADGASTITGFSTGADCASTLRCLHRLGVAIDDLGGDETGRTLVVHGRGLRGLRPAADVLDAGNSGSRIRMLAGLLAGHAFRAVVTGDESLRRRPMRRLITPLERMGARIEADGDRPPLVITGTGAVTPIDFAPDVPSAQVKTAVLLAGLYADGITRVTEPAPTRDHTERAFRTFGVEATVDGRAVAVAGGQTLRGTTLQVPGDISSAAFWMTAAAALPGSEVTITGVGLNPTRSAIVDVLRRAGAVIDIDAAGDPGGEPAGTLVVRHGPLRPLVVSPAEVPGLIDELPVLGALATHGGQIEVSGAAELRVKESDRITALADGLRRMGGTVEERPDGFVVRGGTPLRGGEVDAHDDHRLAMAFAVAALGATGPTIIHGAGAAAISYPEFFTVLDTLRA
jgi:3-phosphoshikimate 1-carboxyvinyltransferase